MFIKSESIIRGGAFCLLLISLGVAAKGFQREAVPGKAVVADSFEKNGSKGWTHHGTKKDIELSVTSKKAAGGKKALKVKVNNLPNKRYTALFRSCRLKDASKLAEVFVDVYVTQKGVDVRNFNLRFNGKPVSYKWYGRRYLPPNKWVRLRFPITKVKGKPSINKIRLYFNNFRDMKPGTVFYLDNFTVKVKAKKREKK